MNLQLLAGGIGIVLAIFGLWGVVANLRFLARSTAVTGRFVRWEVSVGGKVGSPSSSQGRNSYRPVVAYRAADGKERQVTGAAYRQSRRAPAEKRDAPYPVRYRPSDPKDARVVTFVDFWMFPLGALAVGIASLLIAANA